MFSLLSSLVKQKQNAPAHFPVQINMLQLYCGDLLLYT